MTNVRCDQCRFSELQKDGDDFLLCLRNPPVYNPHAHSNAGLSYGTWPKIKFNWWCGEYKPKADPVPQPSGQRGLEL